MYTILLVPIYARHSFQNRHTRKSHHKGVNSSQLSENDSNTALLGPQDDSSDGLTESSGGVDNLDGQAVHDFKSDQSHSPQSAPLTVRETFKLSAKFTGLWFFSNWMNTGSYANTSVASSTILVSTSSVFALLFGALFKVETLTLKKILGVLVSVSGVVLISLIDTEKPSNDEDRGSFPYKSPTQVVIGDAMALFSAILYGLYATFLIKHVGSEDRVNMPLFFGFIGVTVLTTLWPGIGILHLLNIEKFALPQTRRVTFVILANAVISMVSDMCWGFAVLLTSPLVVTVGLTLTIPLSLIGQIMVNSQYASGWYWVGAVFIIVSFVMISYESKTQKKDEPEN